ncbi:MAG: hypothetical protein AAB573_01580 [Patescibacteria group bacterium]
MTRGLTYVEMLVVVMIFSMVMIAIVNSVLYFYRTNKSSIEQAFQIESARKGIELLVRDVREASYSDNGAYPLVSMASSSLTFYSDTDRDNSIELIHYELQGKTLLRTVTNATGTPPAYTDTIATTTISTNVRNFSDNISVFQFFNASGTEATSSASLASVLTISVSLVVDITPQHAPGEFTLRSSATMRNLRKQ